MSGGADIRALPRARRRSALERALGPEIAKALAAPDVVEALVNADGAVWLDRVGSGLEDTGARLSASDCEAAIRLLAHEAGETVGADRPMLATILPDSAARVQAVLPPLSTAPILAVRKRPASIFTLDDYLRQGVATEAQVNLLRRAVAERANIVVAGGTARERPPCSTRCWRSRRSRHRAWSSWKTPPNSRSPAPTPCNCSPSARHPP